MGSERSWHWYLSNHAFFGSSLLPPPPPLSHPTCTHGVLALCHRYLENGSRSIFARSEVRSCARPGTSCNFAFSTELANDSEIPVQFLVIRFSKQILVTRFQNKIQEEYR